MVQTPLAQRTPCSGVEPEAAAALRTGDGKGTAADPLLHRDGRDAACTALMETWRRHGEPSCFDALARLSEPLLLARARARVRALAPHLDPSEVVQDTLVNVYRYPHQFRADRPGAFAAWSTTILDNVIRRHLRRNRLGRAVRLQEDEWLSQQADLREGGPALAAQDAEERELLATAWRILLLLYHRAWLELAERERHVLALVEVHGMRYAEVAAVTGSRPEALKMVVFRARRRIHERIGGVLAAANASGGRGGAEAPAA